MKHEDFLSHITNVKSFLATELTKIRTGRASASLVDDIKVDAYAGSPALPIKELASVSVPDSQSILISPWDKSVVKKIEAAIIASEKGLNPINDGENVRVPIPSITEDRRKDLSKEISGLVEQAKIKIRTLRQDVIKAVEEQQDNGVVSEDDMYRMKKEIEADVSKTNMELDRMGQEKEDEVLNK